MRPIVRTAFLLAIAIRFLAGHSSAQAESRTWTGASDGDWFNSGNWSPNDNWPQAGDSASVSSGTVVLSNSTALLDQFVITGGSLVFSNWSSALRATNVVVGSAGTLTHALCDTNAAPDNVHRVHIVCTNLAIHGTINVNQQGHRGAPTAALWGQGPGAARDECGGAHGGYSRLPEYTTVTPYGAIAWPAHAGVTYGSPTEPSDPGSGGGGRAVSEPGGHGGGAVWIEVNDHALVNGTITANGLSRNNNAGGGSGGSIYLRCRTFGATNGTLRAQGGEPGQNSGHTGYGGGGGRIAIVYDVAAQAALNPSARPAVTIHAEGGWAPTYSTRRFGQPGTIHLSDAGFYPTATNVLRGGELIIPGFTSWAPANLTITDGSAVFPSGFTLNISSALTLSGRGGLVLSNATLTVGGDLTMDADHVVRISPASPGYTTAIGNRLIVMKGNVYWSGVDGHVSTLDITSDCIITNTGRLHLQSGATNAPSPGYGALFRAGRDIVVASPGSWIHPASHPTNGGSVFCEARDVIIAATNAGFDATERGYVGGDWYNYGPYYVASSPGLGFGPGRGFKSGSAGYGAAGVVTNKAGGGTAGGTYGSLDRPTDPGSGGGGYGEFGGSGGGLIKITATRTVRVNGALKANSNRSTKTNAGAGGSGGGIMVWCRNFTGDSTGLVEAAGGHGNTSSDWSGAGGGGGRVAIWATENTFAGTYSVTNGLGYDAARTALPGTLFFGYVGKPGTLVVIQ